MDEITRQLGLELKKMRQERNYSQQDIADRLKLGRSTIAGYETGVREISLSNFFKICDICNVDAYAILDKVRKYTYK